MRLLTITCLIIPAYGMRPDSSRAGDLLPPAGPVESTMKPLSVVEPRTPIGERTTPGDDDSRFRIESPGSYYLTGNVFATEATHGIEIAASDVTIDLMGFALKGDSVGLAGIKLDGERNNLTVRNGSVTAWTEAGINLANGGGKGRLIEGVHCSGNGAHGMLTGSVAVVRDCTAVGNGADGFLAGDASIVQRCAARLNGGTGIVALQSSVVHASSARENTFGGFYIEQGGSIESSSAENNELVGIAARDGTRITNCLARNNKGDGINAGDECIIVGNTTSRNDGDGIECDGNSLIKENIASFHKNEAGDGAGIRVRFHGSRIEGNHLRANDFGLNIMHTHNLIICNSAVSNTTNYRIVPSNRVGTIINAAGTNTMINGDSGGSVSAIIPWANMAY